jgi:hypothetical protein
MPYSGSSLRSFMLKGIPSLQLDCMRSAAAAMVSLREHGDMGHWLVGELN